MRVRLVTTSPQSFFDPISLGKRLESLALEEKLVWQKKIEIITLLQEVIGAWWWKPDSSPCKIYTPSQEDKLISRHMLSRFLLKAIKDSNAKGRVCRLVQRETAESVHQVPIDGSSDPMSLADDGAGNTVSLQMLNSTPGRLQGGDRLSFGIREQG